MVPQNISSPSSFKLQILIQTISVSLQNDAIKEHLTLPLLGLRPSSKGLQSNLHLSAKRIAPFRRENYQIRGYLSILPHRSPKIV